MSRSLATPSLSVVTTTCNHNPSSPYNAHKPFCHTHSKGAFLTQPTDVVATHLVAIQSPKQRPSCIAHPSHNYTLYRLLFITHSNISSSISQTAGSVQARYTGHYPQLNFQSIITNRWALYRVAPLAIKHSQISSSISQSAGPCKWLQHLPLSTAKFPVQYHKPLGRNTGHYPQLIFLSNITIRWTPYRAPSLMTHNAWCTGNHHHCVAKVTSYNEDIQISTDSNITNNLISLAGITVTLWQFHKLK